MSRRLYLDPAQPDPAAIARAAAILRRGGLVAFPTETVYGLGANALNTDAVRRIFAAKERPDYNPLIAHVPNVAAARALVGEWPPAAEILAERFWPGPLTFVLPKDAQVPPEVTAGLATVAVRVPAHPVALALLRSVPFPLAAPSANRFTEVSPTTAAHVERSLGEHVELILDAGPTRVGIESTVIDLCGERPVLLRPGMLSVEALSALVGPIDAPDGTGAPDAPRPSPGMLDRHYAPRAELRFFDSRPPGAAEEILRSSAVRKLTVCELVRDHSNLPVTHSIRLSSDPEQYARQLYAALHALDEKGCDLILVERLPDTPAWAGIRDRLERAMHSSPPR